MSAVKDAFHSWLDSDLVVAARNLLEAALFRPNEPQPTSVWKSIISPPMPYWATVFSQACQVISLLILLPILAMAVLDFAGYAVFRTLGLHRQRVRVLRQSAVKTSAVRSSSTRRKPRVYQTDRNRPTDRSNIPSIVKAPLLTPGTYDAETLLRQRARSLSVASADEQEAWLASGGQQARLSTLSRDESGGFASPESDAQSFGELSSPRDYFGRAPRVGVEGALGLNDTDADESGTESGRDSPLQQRSSNNSSRRRGLNFTPLGETVHERTTSAQSISNQISAATATRMGDDASGSNDSSLSNDAIAPKHATNDESSGSNMSSSSWVGVEGDDAKSSIVSALHINRDEAAAAAGLETTSSIFPRADT